MYRFIPVLSVCLLFSFCSCSDTPKDFPKVVPCQITVLQGTTPVTDVAVSLIPTTPVSSTTFFGKTNESGVCDVATTYASHRKKGVPTGSYEVILVKEPLVEHTKTQEERNAMSRPQAEEYRKQMKAKQDALPGIIPKSLTTAPSPLKTDVAESGTTLTVNLEEYK